MPANSSPDPPIRDSAESNRFQTIRLAALFGTFYFIQGIAEPTEGLIAQPYKSMLLSWRHSAEEIAAFAFLIGLPWMFKPLYGLLSDFVPLFGSRRRNYLILSSLAAVAGLGALAFWPLAAGDSRILLWLLILPTLGVAFSDVVVDALMIEKGQPLGITGRLQSVQWSAMYAASILAGSLGGYFSQIDRRQWGFLICAVFNGLMFVLAATAVREPPARLDRRGFTETTSALLQAARSRSLWAIAAFMFLFNFNPFSSAFLQGYMTGQLKFSEQFYGHTVSLISAGSLAGSVGYGFYCRRLPLAWMLHGSIAMGIVSTIAYWWMTDKTSAAIVSVIVGFTYTTATLVQLDLAARICPPRVAGTLFASLLSVSNFSISAAAWIGASWFDRLSTEYSSRAAFNILVGVGAAFTAGCWLLTPWLRHSIASR